MNGQIGSVTHGRRRIADRGEPYARHDRRRGAIDDAIVAARFEAGVEVKLRRVARAADKPPRRARNNDALIPVTITDRQHIGWTLSIHWLINRRRAAGGIVD